MTIIAVSAVTARPKDHQRKAKPPSKTTLLLHLGEAGRGSFEAGRGSLRGFTTYNNQ